MRLASSVRSHCAAKDVADYRHFEPKHAPRLVYRIGGFVDLDRLIGVSDRPGDIELRDSFEFGAAQNRRKARHLTQILPEAGLHDDEADAKVTERRGDLLLVEVCLTNAALTFHCDPQQEFVRADGGNIT